MDMFTFLLQVFPKNILLYNEDFVPWSIAFLHTECLNCSVSQSHQLLLFNFFLEPSVI